MNLTTRVTNSTTVQYAQSKGIEIVLPRGYLSSSPTEKKKKKKKKVSTSKKWVKKAYYTTSGLPGKTSASIFPDEDTLPPLHLKASATNANNLKKAPEKRKSNDKNGPSVYFEESDIHKSAEMFKFCLIGKFPGKKPSLEKIREWAGEEWKLEGDWSITSLDRNHVFVRLGNEADMIKVWPRNRWFMGKHLMKVFKWLPSFRGSSSPSSAEPSLAALWISFPHLPVVFFKENFLHKIASRVGRVICMDEETKNMSRTSMARVCVEVDLVKDLPQRIWIGVGKEQGFWQDVYCESLPAYCTKCSQQGHHTKTCKSSPNLPSANSFCWEINKAASNCEGYDSAIKKDGGQFNTSPVIYGRYEKEDLFGRGRSKQSVMYRFASMDSRNKKMDLRQKTRAEDGKLKQLHASASGLFAATLRSKQEFPHASTLEEKNDSVQLLKNKLGVQITTTSFSSTKNSEIHVEKYYPERVHKKEDAAPLAKDKEVATMDAEFTKSVYNEEQSRMREETTQSMESIPIAKKKFLSKNTLLFWRKKPGKIINKNETGEVIYDTKTGNVSRQHGEQDLVAISCRRFTFEEIKKATTWFSSSLIVGEGGFGRVYKGLIDNYTEVAIKTRAMSSMQGMQEFQTEIDLLSRLRHKHVVTLIGFCREGNQNILVYEFEARGSLKDLLYNRSENLPWAKRLEICVGAAKGLQFLHSNAIIHRDVKPTNILIDENWDAKVSDFGISREGPYSDDKSHVTTQVIGTAHYMDPAYIMTGHVTTKSDVFSFGVVLLEVLFGRAPVDRNLSQDASNLVSWAKRCVKVRHLETYIDRRVYGQIPGKALRKFMKVALLCVEFDPSFRPDMKSVLKVLQQLLDEQEKH